MASKRRSETKLTRKEIEAIFKRREKAQNDHDVEALMIDYADDCVVDSPTGGTHQGRAAIAKVFKAVFDGFPDLKVTTDKLIIDGDSVSHVIGLEGTDLGGFLGVPATGKSFRVPAVFLYEFRKGLIVRERRIYDFTGLLLQIGVMKAKPV
ncbi:MAG: hypothetical protein A3G76_05225 [Acidobacteria bacterium RIFCSPLOWO2_12_FULL_65_11]|nr:MAG: hypothetical protein A3H95_08970 [Acidobacteria bacterium RIFCSPLOWO2_02_FULL_64_15]OFW31408.1 MAG: hypothetical protein A3G76_05225 [Acidobacteria bacterium RIFCSPLOWO2_12_FULL_65_11]